MHRITKLITLVSIGSVFAAAPALAAPGHVPTIESPKALTVDVAGISTPAIATSSVRTPGPRLCAGVQSLTLPASGGARVKDLGREVNTPDASPSVGVCEVVPHVAVGSIALAPKTVDVAAITVAVPVNLATDGSGVRSNAGDGAATAEADSGSHMGITLGTGPSDINVDVAPHL